MMDRIAAASPRQLARTAGGLYLINILGGFFAIGLVPGLLMVSGDAAATAHNIQANELLYRSGIVAHILIDVTAVLMAVIFYDLFKVVNRRLALVVVFFTLVGSAVESANLLNQFVPLVLMGGGPYSSAFTAEQVQAQAYIPTALAGIGYDVNSVFFAGYGLTIGYLVFKSAFLPRVIGVLLAVGASCYLAYGLADILAPAFATHLVPYIQLPSLVGEGSFCLWLLIVGVNVQSWNQKAGAAASRLEWAR
jgi:membrane-associated PAP2 superfamily phosphatase